MRKSTTSPDMRLELKYITDIGQYIVSEGRLTFRENVLRRGFSLSLQLLDALISDLVQIKSDLEEYPDTRVFERIETEAEGG